MLQSERAVLRYNIKRIKYKNKRAGFPALCVIETLYNEEDVSAEIPL